MTNKKKKWRFVVGLIIKLLMCVIMILGGISTYYDHPDSAAVCVLLALLTLFGVLEHIFNPLDDLTGNYKIF